MHALILFLLLAAQPQREEPLAKVLVLGSEQSPVPPTFVEALRIQVMRSAEVVEGPSLRTTTLGERLEEASRLVEDLQAVLAVWIEQAAPRDQEDADFVVYAVGRQGHRALIEVARVPAREGPDAGPDMSRVLALKVGAFLDTILSAHEPEPNLARALRTATPDPPLPQPPVRTEPRVRFVAEVGGLAAVATTGAGVQGGLGLAAGLRRGGVRWCAEAYGALRLLNDVDVAGAAGQLMVHEKIVSGGARALFSPARLRDRISVGIYLEGGARLLEAEGLSPAGGQGSLRKTVPILIPGAEARLRLSGSAALRVAAGLEVDVTRQSFSIDDVFASDLGRLRPTALVSLVFSVP